jgi:CRISPR-associated endonuclease/helicase Cas3
MLSITLEPQFEEEWLGENPSPAAFPSHPLYHQWLTYKAESSLIINAFNTGTGKTKAAFLRLLKRTQEKNFNLDSSEDNVLLIAPTNELLAQHAHDAEKFCNDNKLPYRILSMSRATLDEIQSKPDFSESQLRRGAALHAIMEDPRRTDHDYRKMATLFIVNPDIFYYAFYFRYNKNDRIPLFQDIFTLCNYIIIDEFHYYNPKQLANFLFFMRLSKELGYVDSYSNRQFCLLTATPSQKVDEYLAKLSFPIDRIDPATVTPVESEKTRKVRALARIHLEIYSMDELKQGNQSEADGLIALVDQKRPELIRWISNGEDGAILSSSLWRIEQIYKRLRSQTVLAEHLGRITGPEQRKGREEASHKSLILATPTVDIGYNFEKGNKSRQNIDFLLFDARSSDEFIQRLGRAGRVLGKQQQDIPSRVYAVVDPEFYKSLLPYDRQVLSRSILRQLALEALPPRNDLYAYIESGAIAEAFLPLYRLRQMEETAQEAEIQALFESVRQLFNEDATIKYEHLRNKIRVFLDRESCYSAFETNSSEKLAILERLILKQERHPAKWLDAIEARLREEQERRKRTNNRWAKAEDAVEWLLNDLRCYFIDKARFSFREYFQPPLALISDPRCLHTSDTVSFDDVLRIVRFYKARYFDTCERWERNVQMLAPEKARDAIIFCQLQDLREPGAQLRIGLKLDAGNKLRPQWEEIYAYQLTALYGLEVATLNDDHGLTPEIQHLLTERFIPALVVAKKSRAAVEMWRLQKKAQFIPYNLQVTFADDEIVDYWAILGTMALLVQAEIPVGILKYDWGKAVRSDDKPMML